MQRKSLFLFALSLVHAAPTVQKYQLQYVKRRDVETPFYFPESSFEAFDVPKDNFMQLPEQDIIKIGHKAIETMTGISADEFKITNTNVGSDGITHIYGVRLINNTPVENQHAAVHVDAAGQIVARSSSFKVTNNFAENIDSPEVIVSLDEAVKVATKQFGAPRDEFPATHVYVQLPTGKLVYAHQFQLRDDAQSKWFQVEVDTKTGTVVQSVDYYNEASYNVIKFPNTDPRDGFEIVTDPAAETASPNGWHSDGSNSFTDTRGNNVDSRIGSFRAAGGPTLDFDTAWDETAEPTTERNKRVSVVNNFYVSNLIHDISYQYGFDEKSGNFQQNNFGRGGREGDPVTVNNHASGSNNANFATPPDGQRPTMNMFLWTFNTPRRDGSLENSIPIHEYGHGISNRLTGGASQANCLRGGESGGMGEGWSDTFAVFLERKANDTRETNVAIGDYSFNNPIGIRKFVYSTNMTTNPFTYNDINTNSAVHAAGTIWATILYEVYWNLVDRYGFSPNWLDNTQEKGNIIAMQIVIGGLKLQPCNPTFLTARDAILAADKSFYNGANQCLIWKGFAKRGMGTNAVQRGYINGFDLPTECVEA
jgi:extracellular elastinolytic metalloproteinase